MTSQCQYLKYKKEIDKAVLRVLRSGQYINGKEVKVFEDEVCRFLGVKYAVAVSSGTHALLLSLRALGIGKGDEVITTPFTFIATAETIAEAGAKPVFVDIEPIFENIDSLQIEKAITKKTKAIIPVHLFGQLADMDHIMKIARKYKLAVIEDSAQAFGIKGIDSDCKCLSFYPTKVLGGCGDSGMILTNQKRMADKLRMLRNHGSSPKDKYKHLIFGTNSRMDEIQAVILRVKLKHFKELSKDFQYPDGIYYPLPLHLQPCFKYLGYKKGDFPVAEKEAGRIRKYGKQKK